MKIELISPEQYQTLRDIQANHPALTFQNRGYEYIKKSDLSKEDLKALDTITEILKKHVKGFSEFFNFKLDKDGAIKLRFDYNWGADEEGHYFIGVGYLPLDELLNGFKST